MSTPRVKKSKLPARTPSNRTQPSRIVKLVASGRQKLFANITTTQRWAIYGVCNQTLASPQDIFMTGPTQSNLDPSGSAVSFQEMARFTKLNQGTLPGNVLPAYLEMIAAYVNRFYKTAGDNPNIFTRKVPTIALLPTNFQKGIALRVENNQNPQAFFDGQRVAFNIVSAHMTANMMGHQVGSKNSNFFKIKHILVPIASQTTDWKGTFFAHHTSLLVISPEAKTIQHLDPSSHTYLQLGKHCIIDVLNLLAFHLGRDFIPTDWKIRTHQFIGQDVSNMDCTYIAATNALCIAFGYGLDYFDEKGFNMPIRIQRMCSEMINGNFEKNTASDYHYPIIKQPPQNNISDHWITIPANYMDDIRVFKSKARTGRYDHMTAADLQAYVEKTSAEDKKLGRKDRYESFANLGPGGVMHWGPASNPLHNLISTVEMADWAYARNL